MNPAIDTREDEIEKLLSHAQAVGYLMGAAKPELCDAHQTALGNAAWLLDDLLERVRTLALAGGGHD